MKKCQHSRNKGQIFIEFILLLLVMLVLSITLMKVTNYNVGERWSALVRAITGHDLNTPPNTTLR